MKILIVEDERELNGIISQELGLNGYIVESCYDGKSALELFCYEDYDGAVVDIMLPGMNGFSVLENIRAKGIQTPVLFLTAMNDKKDIIRGLDLGADDYISKPFDLDELLARIRVMLRKKVDIRENIYRCGDLEVDCNRHIVMRSGNKIELSAKEYQLLLYLMRNQGIVVTREQIESNLWELEKGVNSNVIDVYIRYLRKKIDDGYNEKMIHTLRGVGYVLKSR